MKRVWFSILLSISLALTTFANEHVILTGGPAHLHWENFRVPSDRHDKWWANFIRASTLRMDEIKQSFGKDAKITWYVYKQAYNIRGKSDGQPYTTWIKEQATKRNAHLVWINSGDDFIRDFNSLPKNQTKTFDFFGHSNKHCFLLDYSSQILGASSAWLHETELVKMNRRPLQRNAICKSWGCHTGESMSKRWKKALGSPLIGANGKTDYSSLSQGKMPMINGRWVR